MGDIDGFFSKAFGEEGVKEFFGVSKKDLFGEEQIDRDNNAHDHIEDTRCQGGGGLYQLRDSDGQIVGETLDHLCECVGELADNIRTDAGEVDVQKIIVDDQLIDPRSDFVDPDGDQRGGQAKATLL